MFCKMVPWTYTQKERCQTGTGSSVIKECMYLVRKHTIVEKIRNLYKSNAIQNLDQSNRHNGTACTYNLLNLK